MAENVHELKVISDERGSLVSIEGGMTVPFAIKRVYYLFKLNDLARGFHAHKELKQFMICLSGSCRVVLNDGRSAPQNIILNSPDRGVFIDHMMWHEMHDFSSDCLLMVLASDHYNESDYIRKYGEFELLTKAVN